MEDKLEPLKKIENIQTGKPQINMSELQTQTTSDLVTAKMNLALTKATISIQEIQNIESNLVYNEDNLTAISDFIALCRKAEKIIDAEHKIIKEAALKECQIIDEGKRNMKKLVSDPMEIAVKKYTAMCQEIDNRKRFAEQEKVRKENIQSGIDKNMMLFSSRIAECKTNDELLSIERLINLEKANKSKYQEFILVAVEKYNSLTELLKTQKESVKAYEKLEAERKRAESEKNDEALIKIQEKQIALEATIEEAKVTVQEKAIEQAVNTVIEATEILPEIKVKRQSWTFEVVDINTTAKKMNSWVTIEPNVEKINEFLKASKDTWATEGKEEVILYGIRFFLRKTY